MNKGYVFIETIIVIALMSLSIASIYSLSTKVTGDIEIRRYYDNISDLYKTNIIRKNINKDVITNLTGHIEFNKDNCTSYMTATCNRLLSELEVENVILTKDPINTLLLNVSTIPNSMQMYLKTINTLANTENKEKLIIVNYKYNGKNYYASLKI